MVGRTELQKANSYNRVGACYAYTNDSVALIYFKKAFEISPADSWNSHEYNKCLERLKDKEAHNTPSRIK